MIITLTDLQTLLVKKKGFLLGFYLSCNNPNTGFISHRSVHRGLRQANKQDKALKKFVQVF